MAGRVLLPEGDASENHEKSVLLAVKTELLDVKEKINPLLFIVNLGLGLPLGSALPDPSLLFSSGSISLGLTSRPAVKGQNSGGKEKVLLGVGPKTNTQPVWWVKTSLGLYSLNRGMSPSIGPNSSTGGPPSPGPTQNQSTGAFDHFPIIILPVLSPVNEVLEKVLQDASPSIVIDSATLFVVSPPCKGGNNMQRGDFPSSSRLSTISQMEETAIVPLVDLLPCRSCPFPVFFSW